MLMFTDKSFKVFEIEGLENRMAAIRSEIQPIFQELDDYFKNHLEKELNEELFVHIAQHRRRSVYPPENTWSALSRKKRGYKMEPHFQLGIFPEYVFMWLSFIDNPQNEKAMAEAMLAHPEVFPGLTDFSLSLDHTQAAVLPLEEADLQQALTRFRDVKKGEFQIGRIIYRGDKLFKTPTKARKFMLETYMELLPLYRLVMPWAIK
ncbi:DUF1054 domain-containing protein [Enterococcus sp. HY326]|uniref:DUF1054 domain-containing protein n=1 Tax=Enterococcus sp. HY326 TaxID=2971265 RepID=UPI00223F22DD|nr:DUF1054 domain-containing protein [Enterococcus sp. HY326]